jgi:hypothetical protein
MKKGWIGCFLLLVFIEMSAQETIGIERIFVEEFYRVNSVDASIPQNTGEVKEGAVTYRVYLDLLPGYRFQAAYGTPQHPLYFRSSDSFYNHVEVGNANPNVIPERTYANNIAYLDSWLSIGAAGENHLGIPLSLDTTKDWLEIKWNGQYLQSPLGNQWAIEERDGLVRVEKMTFPTFYNMDEQKKLIHADTRSSELVVDNGAWAAMGKGTVGADSLHSNMILIGQFTTAGDLNYGLNIMIRTPEGKSVRYVYDQPGEGEILLPLLKANVNYYRPLTKAEKRKLKKQQKQIRKK